MRTRIKKVIGSVVIGVCILAESSMCVWAEVPYETYNFNYWGEAVVQPHSYQYSDMFSVVADGKRLLFPEDMCRYKDVMYVADTGNSRVIKLDVSGNVEMIIEHAKDETDKLNGPQGVFVTEEGHLYIADSGNGRIVEYDEKGLWIRSIGRPETDLLDQSATYKPLKVVVDQTGRIYVTAYGINMGLVEFDRNGVFQGFMGAAKVSVSPLEYIWKNYFSTEAQQARMETIIPTEYSNIFVDDENFIYATISNLTDESLKSGADAIRRLNPTGTDVLRRLSNYEIIGDIGEHVKQFSTFCDVTATDYGCYFVLDSTNGKVFAYDYDGNSLFVFGKKGIKEGNVQKPSAIALGENEEQIYILDSVMGSILVFDITEYGRHLLDAIALNDIGDSEGANREWQEVLSCNSNNELAYIGLGKTHLAEGNNRKAMEFFKLGNSRKYYSKAFFYYRKEMMEKNFGRSMLMIGILLIMIVGIRYAIKFRRWVGEVRCYMSKH